jgi:hypothetical protein
MHPVISGKPQQQKVREEEEELWELGKCQHKTIQKQTHQKISARKVARKVLDIHS